MRIVCALAATVALNLVEGAASASVQHLQKLDLDVDVPDEDWYLDVDRDYDLLIHPSGTEVRFGRLNVGCATAQADARADDPGFQRVANPVGVPPTWFPEANLVVEPDHDALGLCFDIFPEGIGTGKIKAINAVLVGTSAAQAGADAAALFRAVERAVREYFGEVLGSTSLRVPVVDLTLELDASWTWWLTFDNTRNEGGAWIEQIAPDTGHHAILERDPQGCGLYFTMYRNHQSGTRDDRVSLLGLRFPDGSGSYCGELGGVGYAVTTSGAGPDIEQVLRALDRVLTPREATASSSDGDGYGAPRIGHDDLARPPKLWVAAPLVPDLRGGIALLSPAPVGDDATGLAFGMALPPAFVNRHVLIEAAGSLAMGGDVGNLLALRLGAGVGARIQRFEVAWTGGVGYSDWANLDAAIADDGGVNVYTGPFARLVGQDLALSVSGAQVLGAGAGHRRYGAELATSQFGRKVVLAVERTEVGDARALTISLGVGLRR